MTDISTADIQRIQRLSEFSFDDEPESNSEPHPESTSEDSDLYSDEPQDADTTDPDLDEEQETEVYVAPLKPWQNPYIKLACCVVGGGLAIGGLGTVLNNAFTGNSAPLANNVSPQPTQSPVAAGFNPLQTENANLNAKLGTDKMARASEETNRQIAERNKQMAVKANTPVRTAQISTPGAPVPAQVSYSRPQTYTPTVAYSRPQPAPVQPVVSRPLQAFPSQPVTKPSIPPRQPAMVAFGSMPESNSNPQGSSTPVSTNGPLGTQGYQTVANNYQPLSAEEQDFLRDRKKLLIPADTVIEGVVSVGAPSIQGATFSITLSKPLIAQSGETILDKGQSLTAVIDQVIGQQSIQASIAYINSPGDIDRGTITVHGSGGKVLTASKGPKNFFATVPGQMLTGAIGGATNQLLSRGTSYYSDGYGGTYNNTPGGRRDLGSIFTAGAQGAVNPMINNLQSQGNSNTDYAIQPKKKVLIRVVSPTYVSI